MLGTNVALVNPQLLACFVVGIPRVHMVANLNFCNFHPCTGNFLTALYISRQDISGGHPHRPQAHLRHNGCSQREGEQQAAGAQLVWERPEQGGLRAPAGGCSGTFQVACQHLAGAVTHLRVLHLSTTNLTDDQVLQLNHSLSEIASNTQMEAIFIALNESRRISTLSLRRSQVTHLPPPLFVQGVVRLHQVDLGLALISPSQVSKSKPKQDVKSFPHRISSS